jgi:large subunit ribosomal protein L24
MKPFKPQQTPNKTIRKGDKVVAIAGNYKGQFGTVVKKEGDNVTVGGLNLKKKHVRKSQQNPNGGIIDIEKPIHVSNLKVCTPSNKPVKLRTKLNKAGERELFYVEDGKEITHRLIKKSS